MSDVLSASGSFLAGYPLPAVFFFLFLFGFTLPISEEIALIGVGLAIRLRSVPFVSTLAVATLALILADLTLYGLSRLVGPPLLRVRLFSKLIRPERIEEGKRYFLRRGPRIVFACRFVVGLRTAAILSAGFLRLPAGKFFLYDGLSLLLSVPVWLAVGFFFGAQVSGGIGLMGRVLGFAGLACVIFAARAVYRGVKKDRARAEQETTAGLSV